MDLDRILSNLSNRANDLPFGYRFHPTSFEVLQFYLVPKLKGDPLPSAYVKDLDVYQLDPDQIPKNESKYAREDEAYFFVPVTKKLVQGEGNLTRATPKGYWRSYEENVPLEDREGSPIGYKNKLEFYWGEDPKNGVKSDWRMVEYRTNFRVNGNLESCMVCKISRKGKNKYFPDEEEMITMSEEEDEEFDDNNEP